MTVSELHKFLAEQIQNGHAEAKVYFDSEARTFTYHMVRIGQAVSEPCFNDNVILYEESNGITANNTKTVKL